MSDAAPSAQRGLRWQISRRSTIAGIGVCLITLFTLAASQFWLADLLIHFRVQFVLLLILFLGIAVFNRQWKLATLFVVFIVINLLPILPYYFTGNNAVATASKRLRVLSANVLSTNADVEAIARVINQSDADVVAVIEVSPLIVEYLSENCPDYLYQHFEPRGGNFGIGVMSRIPLTDVELIESPPLQLPSYKIAFTFDGQECEMIATHPIPPTGAVKKKCRDGQLEHVVGLFDRHSEQACQILVGDFNLTPWSPEFRKLLKNSGLKDASVGFGVQPTWHVFPTYLGGLKIDHVLVSPETRVTDFAVIAVPGSDHSAVLAELEIVRQ